MLDLVHTGARKAAVRRAGFPKPLGLVSQGNGSKGRVAVLVAFEPVDG